MIDTLPRRRFLKFGAALPLAVGALPAATAAAWQKSPQRIIFINNSLGFFRSYFNPSRSGQLDTSKYLGLIECPEDVTVIENLYHPGMETSNHDSEKSFLTGAPHPEASGFHNTISLDQRLAAALGGATRFPFLSFSIYDRGWGCSWNARGAAISPMHDAEKIFSLLFEPEDLRQKQQQIADDKRILASLRRDLARHRDSQDTSHTAETYRGLIRELEAQLRHDEFWLETSKPKVDNSLIIDLEF